MLYGNHISTGRQGLGEHCSQIHLTHPQLPEVLHCSRSGKSYLGSLTIFNLNLGPKGERETDRQRQKERQTDREIEREKRSTNASIFKFDSLIKKGRCPKGGT